MSTIRLSGATSGYYDLTVPAVAGTNSIDLSNLPVKDSNGNLGIGTSSPSASHRLTLDKTSNYGGVSFNQNGNQVGQIIQEGGTGNLYIDADSNSLGGGLIFRTTSGTTRMTIDGSGRVTMPYQPVFAAYGNGGNNGTSSTQDVTALVTKFNIGAHFSNGVFTAPVAGIYEFHFCVLDQGNTGRARVRKNGSDYWNGYGGAGPLQLRYTGNLSNMWAVMHMEMSVNDTAQLFVENTPYSTESSYLYFAGKLLG